MKKLVLFIFGIVLSIHISAQTPLTTAVDFTATDMHGETINLFEILDGGQYVLIDFFYMACSPCQAATPKIAEAYSLLGCNLHEVFFMEISNRDNNTALETWVENYGIEYPTIGSDGGGATICSTYSITAYPTIILIAPDRNIVIRDLWPVSSAATIVNALAPYEIEQHDCDEVIVSCNPPLNLMQQQAVKSIDPYVWLSWDNPEEGSTGNLIRYDIYRDGVKIYEEFEIGHWGGWFDDEDPELVLGKSYFYIITAVYDDGCEAPSEELEAIATDAMSLNENTINISVYPNPAKDFVKITSENIKQIHVYNTMGQLLLSQESNGNEATIATGNLQSGVYILEVTNFENRKTTQRLVVSN